MKQVIACCFHNVLSCSQSVQYCCKQALLADLRKRLQKILYFVYWIQSWISKRERGRKRNIGSRSKTPICSFHSGVLRTLQRSATHLKIAKTVLLSDNFVALAREISGTLAIPGLNIRGCFFQFFLRSVALLVGVLVNLCAHELTALNTDDSWELFLVKILLNVERIVHKRIWRA